MSFGSINACDPLRNKTKNPLLEAILSYLYTFRKLENPSKTLTQIIVGVQLRNPEYSVEELKNGVRKGTRQGLFSTRCQTGIPPYGTTVDPTYLFNRNAPMVNPANWSYMCPGAETMTPGTCRYRPCLSKKGSYQSSGLACPRQSTGPVPQKITIPGVPGSFTRADSNPCPIPI
jgi:hypothetical protein